MRSSPRFAELYRHIADFNGTGTLHGWIGRIAYNTALNARRRRLELPVAPDIIDRTLADTPIHSPEQQCILRETAMLIQRTICELPNRYRNVVHMFCELNLTYQEISRISGIPIGTLKAQIHRARAILYRELTPVLV